MKNTITYSDFRLEMGMKPKLTPKQLEERDQKIIDGSVEDGSTVVQMVYDNEYRTSQTDRTHY